MPKVKGVKELHDTYLIIEEEEIPLKIKMEFIPAIKGTVVDGRQIEPDEPEGHEIWDIYGYNPLYKQWDLSSAAWVWDLISLIHKTDIKALLIERAGVKT